MRYYYDPVLEIPVCDVVDSYGGTYVGVRVITPGGGDPENFELRPPPVDDPEIAAEVTGEVLLVLGDGIKGIPYVLGTCYVADLASQVTTDTTDTGDDKEYDDLNHVYDRVTRHRGARMVFSYSGTWVLDLTSTQRPARFQLDKDSYLRISQDDDAEEYVLLGTKTLEHLRAVHKRLDALADAIKANGADIQTITTHKHEVSGTSAAASTDLTDMALAAATDPTNANYPFNFGGTESIAHASDGGSDNLVAGCFRISDIPYSDQE
jgi:hypothetical protein